MRKRNITILIIDDEPNVCSSLQGILEDEGYTTYAAQSGEEGLKQLAQRDANIVLLDILMPGGMDGIETLRRIKNDYPDVGVIMITGHGTYEYALEAGKLGALDFIEKPLSIDKVLTRIEQALEKMRLEAENVQLKRETEERYRLIGESSAMQEIKKTIARVAPTKGRVLITGESGTGKELVARAIHNQSLRSDGLFVPVNCAAIPQELIEAELFGHERGAFTGATYRRIGKFEQADGGTIFLDEIGNMSLQTQAKVLRAIETQEFERIGGKNTIKVDNRIIAATNKDLDAEIKEGHFREDLYYRLNVIPIDIPPLRRRKKDIPLLAEHFLVQFCRENNKPKKQLSKEAMKILERYSWPGNVRELRNIIERLVIMSRGDVIEVDDLPQDLEETMTHGTPGSLRDARRQFESNFIRQSLDNNNWNIAETARQLGIERTNLYRKMRQYSISRGE
ncbi:TPA: sigma-54-dependent Fis family transcriptional regulator [Candidatus Poribacteria bacterium]|nr:sigma-54-dependent Fis family transcriptional regulator [Candidatus Poribacteria bacterium]